MKVVLVSKSDSTGGAAVVTKRLMDALRAEGVDARMLVIEKRTDSPFVETIGEGFKGKMPFLEERLQIFLQNGLSRRDLFKADTAAFGLHISRHPIVREADVVCLGWVNQGMVSLSEVRKIAAEKPVIWTMHDMWNLTGICHHAGDCQGYLDQCGNCPLLGFERGTHDLSRRVHKKKAALYSKANITFVAVSSWLGAKAAESSLLGGQDVRVIPNPFPVEEMLAMASRKERNSQEITLIMGAARLDDPIKGLPILVEATKILREENPELANRLTLKTFGRFKNPDALAELAISHTHLGPLTTPQQVAEAYSSSDIVVSSSLFETLPGTLIEGLAYGCIPVTLDRGGQRDIVDHGETGFVAPFGPDAHSAARSLALALAQAAEVATDENNRKIFAARGLQSLRDHFSAPSVASRYLALFADL